MLSRRNIVVLLALFALFSASIAGNTGKIAGRVTDKQSGEPLIGVNILVKGTELGSATDEDGFYYILQVPPGTYDLEATYIGYHNITVKDVRVKVDLTQRINITMESSSVEGPTVEVVAEQPLVQRDITSTRRVASRQEMQDTPGFTSTNDIFRLQGGSVVDNSAQSISLSNGTQLQVRDESLKDIHVRGGRGGEILFMVDGVPVTHPIYGGRDVLDLNIVDVQEMELLTGAFNAEYGQAQSGVVNITTRSGGNRFEGGLEYKSSQADFLGYNTLYSSFYLGGPEPFTNNLFPAVGLKLPGRMYFFLSGNADLDETPHSNGRIRDDITLFGLNFKEKQNNSGNVNLKLNWILSNKIEFVGSYHGSWLGWSNYDWLWKNFPNQTADYNRSNQNFTFRMNHTLSKSTFYNINLGYLSVKYQGSLNDVNGNRLSPADYWVFLEDSVLYDYGTFKSKFSGAPDAVFSSIRAPQTDPFGFFDRRSYQDLWRNDFTRTYTFKGDITSQIHPEHLIKAGLEVQYNDLKYVDIQDGGEQLSYYGEYVFNNEEPFVKPNGPFKEFGRNRWVFNAFPTIGGLYLQDKFEKETLIINAGMRLDWFTVGSTVRDKTWKKAWADATGLRPDWKWYGYKLSPRFGISFPISEKTVVFFSYGHFNQLPEMQFFYRDPYTGGFTGNPGLDYEQTILYEFGFTHQIAKDWALDIKSYTKDISKQVGTTQLRANLGLNVSLYDNNGYARARGLEFELIKRASGFTAGKLTYTVQWANGYSSSAFEDYIRSLTDFPNPIRERRLSWDIRHQIILQATIASSKGHPMNLFGLRLPDDWNLTILSRFSSGQPYSPGTFDPVVAQKTENQETGPVTTTTDIKFSKTFRLMGFDLSPFVDVFNIFDRRNVQVDSRWFNTWTGEPYRYGDLVPEKNQYYDWYTMYRLMDPRQFNPGRLIKLGMRLNF
jgi:outer membrane receptor protein involved in Fe transport